MTFAPEINDETRTELRELLAAYDDALTDFDNDHLIIFPSDNERKRLFFEFLKRWDKAWSRRGPCMHDGCQQRSIARSHTISLGTSIRLIAENDHVLTPRFGEGGLELVPVGVREASTFPGFCEEHEAQFAVFETKKTMTEVEHFRLQAFRTICREIYAKRHQIQKAEEMLSTYERLRHDFVVGRIRQVPTGNASVKNLALRFEGDPIEAKLVGMLDEMRRDLPELEQLYRDILADLQTNSTKVAMIAADLDMRLPVCLSGLGVLNYVAGCERRRSLCFLAILPEQGRTKILLGAAAEHGEAIKLHFADTSSPSILEKLESWMLHGSDHWFITPSAWEAIPIVRQRAICNRILELRSLADGVPFSILDDARNQVVRFIEADLITKAASPDQIDNVEAVLAREKAKLDYRSSPSDLE
jgi:hypothetical protein